MGFIKKIQDGLILIRGVYGTYVKSGFAASMLYHDLRERYEMLDDDYIKLAMRLKYEEIMFREYMMTLARLGEDLNDDYDFMQCEYDRDLSDSADIIDVVFMRCELITKK